MKNKQQITIDQHYVQKAYLKSWTLDNTVDGEVYAMIGELDVKLVSIKTICFGKKFYKIPILNDLEIEVVKRIGRLLCINDDDVNSYLHNHIVTKKINDSLCDDLQTKKDLNNMLIQLGEDFQRISEERLEFVEKTINNQAFLNNYEDKRKFLSYIFSQYYRTPQMKKRFAKKTVSYFGNKIDGENIWAVIQGMIVDSKSYYVSLNDFGIIYLLNNNETKFITSDSPVVVLDNKNEFYYPFNPNIALIISPSMSNKIVNVSHDEVLFYNRLIKDNTQRTIVFPPDFKNDGDYFS